MRAIGLMRSDEHSQFEQGIILYRWVIGRKLNHAYLLKTRFRYRGREGDN